MLEKYSLYGGRVILYYDPGTHIYSVNGKIVYGVTNIVKVIDKPALKYWAVNKAIEYLQNNLTPGVALDEIQIKNLLEEARYAHTKAVGVAADLGDMTHNWIERFLRAGLEKKPLPKKPVNKEIRSAVDNFLKWAKEHRVKFLASEVKVFSRKYGYAGTLDAEAMVDGKKTIIDFKTSNEIFPDMLLQSAAYLVAKEEEERKKYAGGIKIIRLSKDNREKDILPFEVKSVERKDIKRLLKVFLACLEIYKWQMSNKAEEIAKKNGNN